MDLLNTDTAVFILTCLVLFETFQTCGGTILANKKIIHHKWNQLSQLITNTRFMVPTQTAGTQKFHNVQVTFLTAVNKRKIQIITSTLH